MGRVIVHEGQDVRSASSLIDLDGVQALITLCASEGHVGAEIRFRSGPAGEFSEPVVLGDDFVF